MDRILQTAFELEGRTQKPLYLYSLPYLNKTFQCAYIESMIHIDICDAHVGDSVNTLTKVF